MCDSFEKIISLLANIATILAQYWHLWFGALGKNNKITALQEIKYSNVN